MREGGAANDDLLGVVAGKFATYPDPERNGDKGGSEYVEVAGCWGFILKGGTGRQGRLLSVVLGRFKVSVFTSTAPSLSFNLLPACQLSYLLSWHMSTTPTIMRAWMIMHQPRALHITLPLPRKAVEAVSLTPQFGPSELAAVPMTIPMTMSGP